MITTQIISFKVSLQGTNCLLPHLVVLEDPEIGKDYPYHHQTVPNLVTVTANVVSPRVVPLWASQ